MFLKWKFREFLWNQIFSFLEVSLICYNIVTSCLLPSNYSVSPGLPAARPRGGYGSSILTSILCLMHIIWLLDIGSPHWNWDICLKNLCWWAVLLTNHLSVKTLKINIPIQVKVPSLNIVYSFQHNINVRIEEPCPGGVCFNIKFLPAVTVSEVPRPPAAPPHSRLELQTIHRQQSVFTITEKAPTRHY